MTKNTWHRVEIAPIVTITLGRSPFFSYASDRPIPRGSLVRISFGRQELLGIVFESHPVTKNPVPSWMKKVGDIEFRHYLTETQLSLALSLSESTLTPLGICLKHFVVSRARAKKTSDLSQSARKITPLPLPSPAEKKIASALSKKTKTVKLLHTAYGESVRNILLSFLHEKTAANEQVLFLVPELFLVEWWYQELGKYFPEKAIALVHSHLKGSAIASSWERIRSGQTTIILGTRQALFAPFAHLSTILITDEEDQTSYKQWEMSPRYTVRMLADELVQLRKVNLILFTPTPSLATQLALSEKFVGRIPGPKPVSKMAGRLVNMRFEKKKHERSVLSQDLLTALERTLNQNHKAFLVAKQRGWSSFSICRHCRTVLRCPQCEKVLTGDRDGRFSCLSCGYRTGLFPQCRSCQEMTFLSFGAGTDRVEREIRTHFPQARILRLDKETKSGRELHKTIEAVRCGEYDILIGTNTLVKVPNLPKTSLIAMIEADSLLTFPDYQAEEKLVRDLERLQILSGDLDSSLLLIQTFDPEQLIFSRSLTTDYLETGKTLLAERSALHYPPYTRFVKIECHGKTLADSKKIAERLEQDLIQLQSKEKSSFLLVPHHLPLSPSRKKYYQLFLRMLHSPLLPPPLTALLLRYARECVYDIDPLTLN